MELLYLKIINEDLLEISLVQVCRGNMSSQCGHTGQSSDLLLQRLWVRIPLPLTHNYRLRNVLMIHSAYRHIVSIVFMTQINDLCIMIDCVSALIDRLCKYITRRSKR